MRYAPLTLSTLAALVPADLTADIRIVDEGIEDVDTTAEADLAGMAVITGNAPPRAYALAARFRGRGVPVVLGARVKTLHDYHRRKPVIPASPACWERV